jgi:hypothetical protein
MELTRQVRGLAADGTDIETAHAGMEQKSREFREHGSVLYLKQE